MEKTRRHSTRFISVLLVLAILASGMFCVVSNAVEGDSSDILRNHFDSINLSTHAYPPPSENTCGYNAMSLLLSYYDAFINENFVPELLEGSEGVYSVNTDTIRKTFSGVGEMNAWLDYQEENPDKTYADFQIEHQFDYLQPYLISIGKMLGYSNDSDDNHNPDKYYGFGVTITEMKDILEIYLYNVCGFSEEDVRVCLRTENEVGQTALEQTVRSKISNGFPVIYCGSRLIDSTSDEMTSSQNSEKIGHAMIAYTTTIENGSETIKLHTGWISNTYTTVSSTPYIYNNAVIWLEITDDLMVHNHTASNESQKDFEAIDSDDKFCTCQIFSEHPMHEYNHIFIKKYNVTRHFEECHCGEIINTEYHDFTYISNTLDEHTEECPDCGYQIVEDHEYWPEFVSTTHHEGLCECGHYDGELEPHYAAYYKNKSKIFHNIVCRCGHVIGTEAHSIVAGAINNYCEDCGAVLGSGNITIKSIEEEDTTTVE